tara:strand:- start:1406 stop:2056 length:651 start_codon:yes stop_codon:yes gene_type:complete
MIVGKIEWLSKQDPRIERLFQFLFWYTMKVSTMTKKKYNLLTTNINQYIIEPWLQISFPHYEPEDVFFIKNGKIIDRIAFMYINDSNTKSDMVLYEWTMPDDNKYDHVILRFNTASEVSDNFKMSKVNLLAIQITIKHENANDTIHSIDFQKDNYYIENNILFDQIFINYWCKEKLHIDNVTNYEVSFLDNEMSLNIIKPNEYIIIGKNDFEVVTL